VPAHEWPFGQYPAGGLRPLGPHVTAFHGDSWPYPNSAIVRGRDATLVFDANLPWLAPRVREAVDAGKGPPLTHLVLSHDHGDHAHGASWFAPPARTWARAYAGERLASFDEKDRQDEADFYADAHEGVADVYRELSIVVPDEIVEAERVIDLGGVAVRLVPEPVAHTAGDLWAVVEPDGIVLAGDLWCNGMEGYLGDGSVAGEVAAIDHLRDAGGVCLPGHGPPGPIGADDPLQRYARFIVERTAEGMGAGLSGEALQRDVRAAYDRGVEDEIGFLVRKNEGFLEIAVESVEEAARG
jgi:glyoxylase-like metal-dependent hydrolase (beta-lactamase superfamily II)